MQERRQRVHHHGWGLSAQQVILVRGGDVWGVVFWASYCYLGFPGLAVGKFQSLQNIFINVSRKWDKEINTKGFS